jgi:hypothetical protein
MVQPGHGEPVFGRLGFYGIWRLSASEGGFQGGRRDGERLLPGQASIKIPAVSFGRGDYHGPNHRMPTRCNVMLQNSWKVIAFFPTGKAQWRVPNHSIQVAEVNRVP